MTAQDWIAIAGILCGGGVISQLLIFFVKRSDEKRSMKSTFYRQVYNTLSDYSKNLYVTVSDFIRHNASVLDKAKQSEDTKSLLNDESNVLYETIQKQSRKCKKKGKPNPQVCELCQKNRERLTDLSNKLLEEQKRQDLLLSEHSHYWNTHLEDLKNIASKYSNFTAVISAEGIPKKIIKNAIGTLDIQTLKIIGIGLKDISDDAIVGELIIECLKAIDKAMIEVAKEIS